MTMLQKASRRFEAAVLIGRQSIKSRFGCAKAGRCMRVLRFPFRKKNEPAFYVLPRCHCLWWQLLVINIFFSEQNIKKGRSKEKNGVHAYYLPTIQHPDTGAKSMFYCVALKAFSRQRASKKDKK